MRHVLTACLSILAAGPAHAQTSQPPPIQGVQAPPPPDQTVLFVPEASTSCADGPLAPLASDAFAPTQWGATFVTRPVGQRIERAAYAFSISPEGRPLTIRPVVEDGLSQLSPPVDAETQAAFASWRFPAEARSDCRLALRYTPTPLAQAEVDTLVKFYALARPSGALRQAVERRLRRPGDDCERPPALRTLAYPDFLRTDRPRPGSRSWAAVRWNIAADGSTTAVETVGSSGDAVLDAEVRRAIAETTYRSGPRTGCLYSYWRDGPPLPAPPVNRDPPEDPLARCSEAINGRFTPGPLTYPPAFQNRGIEGWARVRFDVAPWGEIGNVSVVEVQPAAAFGGSAERIVASGRVTPAFDAEIRCVVPIIFRLPEAGEPQLARLPGTGEAPAPPAREPPAPF